MATFVSTLNGFGALGDPPAEHAAAFNREIESARKNASYAGSSVNPRDAALYWAAAWSHYGSAEAHARSNDNALLKRKIVSEHAALHDAWLAWVKQNLR